MACSPERLRFLAKPKPAGTTLAPQELSMSYDRITSDNAALLMVDHQTGLANGVQTMSPPEFVNNVKALATLGKLYNLPAIVTTSAADGPNGPVMPVVTSLLTDATLIHRPGEVNAFDNPDFAAAVKKLDRKKLLIAGISTEVCVAFAVLSALKQGYEVYAVVDASGTWDTRVEQAAIARMVQAGAIPITWCAVGAELMGDWRSPVGQAHGALMAEHLPFAGNLFASFAAAKVA